MTTSRPKYPAAKSASKNAAIFDLIGSGLGSSQNSPLSYWVVRTKRLIASVGWTWMTAMSDVQPLATQKMTTMTAPIGPNTSENVRSVGFSLLALTASICCGAPVSYERRRCFGSPSCTPAAADFGPSSDMVIAFLPSVAGSSAGCEACSCWPLRVSFGAALASPWTWCMSSLLDKLRSPTPSVATTSLKSTMDSLMAHRTSSATTARHDANSAMRVAERRDTRQLSLCCLCSAPSIFWQPTEKRTTVRSFESCILILIPVF